MIRGKDNNLGNLSLREIVMARLDSVGIKPSERIGQNFLVDNNVLEHMVSLAPPGGVALEIGSGPGQLTEVLASHVDQVIGVELDPRFKPLLDEVKQRCGNVRIIYADAIALPLRKILPNRTPGDSLYVVANIPYHITEPLMHKLSCEPIDGAVLMVGKRFAETVRAENENSPDFSKLTLLAQTFFTIGFEGEVDRESFYPVPSTQSEIVTFVPKSKDEAMENRRAFVFRRLFLTADANPTVISVLKNALVEYGQGLSRTGKVDSTRHQRRDSKRALRDLVGGYNFADRDQSTNEPRDSLLQDQHRALKTITSFKLPERVLDRPFNTLGNPDLRALSKALGN